MIFIDKTNRPESTGISVTGPLITFTKPMHLTSYLLECPELTIKFIEN